MTLASASQDQPDKRQFGSLFLPESLNPGVPPFLPPFVEPAVQRQYKPDAVFTLGNLQRTWQSIDEKTVQYALNLTLPFEQWNGNEGYFKFGVFDDNLKRTFDQSSWSNFNDNTAQFEALPGTSAGASSSPTRTIRSPTARRSSTSTTSDGRRSSRGMR